MQVQVSSWNVNALGSMGCRGGDVLGAAFTFVVHIFRARDTLHLPGKRNARLLSTCNRCGGDAASLSVDTSVRMLQDTGWRCSLAFVERIYHGELSGRKGSFRKPERWRKQEEQASRNLPRIG